MIKHKENPAMSFYDSVSAEYDSQIEDKYLTSRIRENLHRRLLENFSPGERILDLGCGTGTDAIRIARQGICITAIDPSGKMLNAAKEKVRKAGLSDQIELKEAKCEDIKQLGDSKFRGAYSNFNVLNHLKDLEQLSNDLKFILNSKSKVFLVMLNKSCPIESMFYFLRIKPAMALRKLFKRESTFKVELKLYFPRQVKRLFADNFRTVSITGFGVLLPNDNFPGIYKRFRKLFEYLGKVEDNISSIYPFYNFCDHYLIELEKK